MKDHAELRAIQRRVDLRLLPPLYFLAIVLALDGTNIGVASIEGMLKDLHMHQQDINVAIQVFYIPCVLFAVPANLVLLASRPRFFLGGAVFLTGLLIVT